jgi:spermidine synthase
MSLLSVYFLLSGFCSILYELVWLRLSMAQFGVTTALVSIVLSTFMAGLGVGSWLAGRTVERQARIRIAPLRIYALAEAVIGIGALVVPLELKWGGLLVSRAAGSGELSVSSHYLLSGLMLALTLLPWCAAMGATIPLGMFAIREDRGLESSGSFSYLYKANVLGSMLGSLLPLLLIELVGFLGTLRIGALLNFAIAAAVFARTKNWTPRDARVAEEPATPILSGGHLGILFLLFSTGLATMGMEVIWIRLLTPYVGPVVYSFGLILCTYLLATFAGSRFYREWIAKHREESPLVWVSLAVLGVLPLLACDVRLPIPTIHRVLFGVGPFAAVIGFLTPMLVDRWSGGDPDRAGRAYAVNVAGCILGPLVSGFVLLPRFGEHFSLLLFSLPWLALIFQKNIFKRNIFKGRARRLVPAMAMTAGMALIVLFTKDYETRFEHREVRRDSTATVIATGEGMKKQLLTNGVGMTMLTPITKMMAHVTLASLDHEPKDALVICFGMGTTFRSLLSWNVNTTAVELVPSVPELFHFYHADSEKLLNSTHGKLVIDDGRRFLERTSATYDAILLDPPPPVTAAGSSLLYSEDSYAVAKKHLRAGGILQQWLPYGDDEVQAAVARALKNSFPYVVVHPSVERPGWHYFASMSPIPDRSPEEMLARMPEAAVKDMMEWGPAKTPVDQLKLVVGERKSLDDLIALSPKTPALADDRPINEYYWLRALAQ